MCRDEEKSKLKELVLQDDFQVISVLGIGGVGKTTLVRRVFRELIDLKEDNKPSNLFVSHAWVTILHPFNIEEFLRNLALQLRPLYVRQSCFLEEKIGIMGLSELKDRVNNVLQSERCLIVLDDLSSIEEWNSIEPFMLTGTCHIILTTREESVAEHCLRKKGKILPLKALNEEQALGLFKKEVFYNANGTGDNGWPDPGMKEQANLILKKCHGLPLLITALGGFLASKPKNAIEWKKWNDLISAEFQTNPSLVVVKKTLSSIYDGLPYHLKPCFLYLSIFPRDCKIRQRRLVKRWTAEGYGRESHGKTATKTGESYFMELINRSMIKPLEAIGGTSNNSARSDYYLVHSLVHQISMSKSEEEILVLIPDDNCSLDPQRKIRHLAVSSSWSREKNDMEKVADFSRTRSVTVFGEWRAFFISKNMKLLRVLDLEDTRGLQDQDLEPMGNLHHLKYLSLRGSQGVSQLPDSFGNLCSLETLDIRGTCVTKLPGCIVKLLKLVYIRAGNVASNDGSSSMKIDICKELPKYFSQVYNRYAGKPVTGDQEVEDCLSFFRSGVLLKHPNVHGVQVPNGVKKLKNLHTLGVINVSASSGKEILKELRKFTQLRKLGATGIIKGNSKEFCSAISHLSRLESLSVRSEGKPGLEGCLDDIYQPPMHLKSLKLYGNLGKLPEWIDRRFSSLVKLNLQSTRLKYDAIPILGRLPNLTILRLWRKSIKGGVVHFRKNFPSLVVLELVDLDDVVFVKFTEKAAPKLEQLLVRDCWSIDKIGISGLSSLESLKQVTVQGTYYKRLKEDLEEQLKDRKAILKMDYIQPKGRSSAQKYLRTSDEQ